MVAGRKRKHEDENQDISKRSKTSSSSSILIEEEVTGSSTYITLFDRVIETVSGFLRRAFGRRRKRSHRRHRSTMTSSHLPSSQQHHHISISDGDQTTFRTTRESFTDDEDDDDYDDDVLLLTAVTRESSDTRDNQYTRNQSHTHSSIINNGMGSVPFNNHKPSTKPSSKGTRSKVSERIAKQRDDAKFCELLDSYSNLSIDQTSPHLNSFPDSLGSLSSTRLTKGVPRNIHTAPLKSSLPGSNNRGFPFLPRLYSPSLSSPPPCITSSKHGSRLQSSALVYTQTPPHFNTVVSPSPILPHPHPHSRSVLNHQFETSSRSNASFYEDVPCNDFKLTKSRPLAPPTNLRTAFDTNHEWISEFETEKFSKFADYKERAETCAKYTQIFCQERMDADDKRNKRQRERFHNLAIRPWIPSVEEEAAELVLELPGELSTKVDYVWGRGSSAEVFAERNNIRITRGDLSTLRGLEWLNDEVINFYLSMVVETVNSSNDKKVHLFNSFFYPKIMSAGYTGVRRWTKKVDIFSHDLILLPVHLGMHWCLASIDLKHKLIQYYDSLKGSNTKCLNVLRDYLVSEARDKKQMEYDVSQFTLECREDIPDQHNGSDCGVFTCMYARHLARDKPMNFSQKDLGAVRRMMVAEIVSNKLLFN